MLDQALTALAAAGGTAVATAAGTEAWAEVRRAVARWFGRGDAQREQTELERLERGAAVLRDSGPAELEGARVRQEALWQARIEAVLEGLNEAERNQAADQLRQLLTVYVPRGGVSAGPGGLTAGGDVTIRAEGGSVAAGVIHGGAHTGHPSAPDPSQG
ncbi:hypothetical protein OG206_00210 [Streptomyces sp. NBC_01341]|uniref:hypothetical protein n=1 Tax=Streptomyces sp. NBC_01341 TaxID=2903831 RepID=UPI002E0F244B|nr:hypothetical protein OG206_00210 [Streptomyces sp. NBC_01341]